MYILVITLRICHSKSLEQSDTNTKSACDCSEQSRVAIVFVYVCPTLHIDNGCRYCHPEHT
jgi:hypothetical protein